MDRVVIFVEKAPSVRVEDELGLVHISSQSGRMDFEHVMSMRTFIETAAIMQEAVAKWRVAKMGVVDSPEAIPFRRKR